MSVMLVVPPLCMVLASFSYGLGVGAVPFALVGELFPVKARAFSSGIVVGFR